jgi:hypothetical protein
MDGEIPHRPHDAEDVPLLRMQSVWPFANQLIDDFNYPISSPDVNFQNTREIPQKIFQRPSCVINAVPGFLLEMRKCT